MRVSLLMISRFQFRTIQRRIGRKQAHYCILMQWVRGRVNLNSACTFTSFAFSVGRSHDTDKHNAHTILYSYFSVDVLFLHKIFVSSGTSSSWAMRSSLYRLVLFQQREAALFFSAIRPSVAQWVSACLRARVRVTYIKSSRFSYSLFYSKLVVNTSRRCLHTAVGSTSLLWKEETNKKEKPSTIIFV